MCGRGPAPSAYGLSPVVFAALCIKRTKLIVALSAFVNINDCEAFRLTINALNMHIDYKD